MKKISILTTVLLAAISCSKIDGEGEIITKQSNVNSSANKILVSSAITLKLSDQMQKGEISISAYENIHQYIIVSNESDELEIRLKDGNYKNLYVEVIASSMQYNDIEASGACNITIVGEAASFDNYTLELSGASEFSGDLAITDLLCIDLSGASNVNLSGEVVRCEAELSGASRLYDTSFLCNTLDVDMSGSSKIQMSVSESISGELSGASTLKYKGTPTVSVETSGVSTVGSI
ncbi:MAG: DUF2807 domain-containing protein [Rikenellaceae bacterium]